MSYFSTIKPVSYTSSITNQTTNGWDLWSNNLLLLERVEKLAKEIEAKVTIINGSFYARFSVNKNNLQKLHNVLENNHSNQMHTHDSVCLIQQ